MKYFSKESEPHEIGSWVKDERDELLRRLKENGLSIRQIEGVTGIISKGVVAKKKLTEKGTSPLSPVVPRCPFVVEKGVSPFSVGKHEDKMGIRGSHTTEMIFNNCRVPKENLLGEIGQGFKIAMATLDGGRIGIGAQALGIAEACLEEAIRYSKERKQFGRPIAANQAIQWMIADMAKDVMAAKLLVYQAASLKDHGIPFSLEAATAKLFASETAVKVATKAVQIHGGYGYVKGSKVERLFRDAKITEIYEGTSEVQRMVVSGSLLR